MSLFFVMFRPMFGYHGPMINPEYWVNYRILGKSYSSGPYESREAAEEQLRDIAGYEGVAVDPWIDTRYPVLPPGPPPAK